MTYCLSDYPLFHHLPIHSLAQNVALVIPEPLLYCELFQHMISDAPHFEVPSEIAKNFFQLYTDTHWLCYFKVVTTTLNSGALLYYALKESPDMTILIFSSTLAAGWANFICQSFTQFDTTFSTYSFANIANRFSALVDLVLKRMEI